MKILLDMDSDINQLFEEKIGEGFFDDYKNKNILVMTFEVNSIQPEHLYIEIEVENYQKIHPKIKKICKKEIDNYRVNFIRKYFDSCLLLFLWDLDKDISSFNETMEIEDLNRWLFVPVSRKNNDQIKAEKEFNQLISNNGIIIPEPSDWTNGMYDDDGYWEDLVLIDGKYISFDKLLEKKEYETTNDLLDFNSDKSGSMSYEGGFEINNLCDIRFYLKDFHKDPTNFSKIKKVFDARGWSYTEYKLNENDVNLF